MLRKPLHMTLPGLCALLLSLSLSSAQAEAPAIVRIPKVPPRPTLDAVLLRTGTDVLVLSGQTPAPLDPKKIDGPEDFGDTRTQALSVFTAIQKLLEKQGYSMSDVVKLTVFLVGEPKLDGRADFEALNQVYAQFFGSSTNPNLPARSVVQVQALGRVGYRVEIEAIAARAGAR